MKLLSLFIVSLLQYQIHCLKEDSSKLKVSPYLDYKVSNLSDIFGDYIILENEDPSSASNLLSQKPLNKCHCKGNEIWYNGTCHPGHNNYIIFLTSEPPYTNYIINETLIKTIVKEIECKENYIKHNFDFTSFLISPTGHIWLHKIGSFANTDEYCLENIINTDNEKLLMSTVCLPITPLNTCCPLGQSFNYTSNSCFKKKTKDPKTLNIYFEEEGDGMQINPFKSNQNNTLKCNESETFENTRLDNSNYLLFWDNEIILQTSYYESDILILSSDQFCIETADLTSSHSYNAVYCHHDKRKILQQYCQSNNCLRKCCPKGNIVNNTDLTCIQSQIDDNWLKAELYTNMTLKPDLPLCKDLQQMKPDEYPADKFQVLNNGDLYFPGNNYTILPHMYCVDYFAYDDLKTELQALVCAPEEPVFLSNCKQNKTYVYQTLFIISSVFLLIALLILIGVTESQKYLFNKCLIVHITSLLFGFILLIILDWTTTSISKNWCIVFGICTQFAFLCCFFWLNILSFDIIYSIKLCNQQETRDKRRERWLKYCFYGYGCPIIFTCITIIMQVLPPSMRSPYLIQPGIGDTRCWFNNDSSIWIYFNGIILILIIFNFILFIVYACDALNPCLAGVRPSNAVYKYHRERLLLSLKMVLLMGLTFIFEVTHGYQDVVCVDNQLTMWFIPDIINALRGVFIFICLMMKEDVQKRVKSLSKASVDVMKSFVDTHSDSPNYGNTKDSSKTKNDISMSTIENVASKEDIESKDT